MTDGEGARSGHSGAGGGSQLLWGGSRMWACCGEFHGLAGSGPTKGTRIGFLCEDVGLAFSDTMISIQSQQQGRETKLLASNSTAKTDNVVLSYF